MLHPYEKCTTAYLFMFHRNSLGKMITLCSTTKNELQIDCFTIDQNDKLMNLDD